MALLSGDSSDVDEVMEQAFMNQFGPNTSKKSRKSTAGRKLMRWNPGEDQRVLLCIDHVCSRKGITLPWNEIAAEMNDFLTGEAIKQHLVKVRAYREAAGQAVPPKLEKGGRKSSHRVEQQAAATAKQSGLLWQPELKDAKHENSIDVQPSATTNSAIYRELVRVVGSHDYIQTQDSAHDKAHSNFVTPSKPTDASRGQKRNRVTRLQEGIQKFSSEVESPAKRFKSEHHVQERINYYGTLADQNETTEETYKARTFDQVYIKSESGYDDSDYSATDGTSSSAPPVYQHPVPLIHHNNNNISSEVLPGPYMNNLTEAHQTFTPIGPPMHGDPFRGTAHGTQDVKTDGFSAPLYVSPGLLTAGQQTQNFTQPSFDSSETFGFNTTIPSMGPVDNPFVSRINHNSNHRGFDNPVLSLDDYHFNQYHHDFRTPRNLSSLGGNGYVNSSSIRNSYWNLVLNDKEDSLANTDANGNGNDVLSKFVNLD